MPRRGQRRTEPTGNGREPSSAKSLVSYKRPKNEAFIARKRHARLCCTVGSHAKRATYAVSVHGHCRERSGHARAGCGHAKRGNCGCARWCGTAMRGVKIVRRLACISGMRGAKAKRGATKDARHVVVCRGADVPGDAWCGPGAALHCAECSAWGSGGQRPPGCGSHTGKSAQSAVWRGHVRDAGETGECQSALRASARAASRLPAMTA